MKIFSKGKIHSGVLRFSDNQVIDTTLIESKEGKLIIPLEFKFNHSWDFSHKCTNCECNVSICEYFEKKTKNFKVINGINSSKYDLQFMIDLGSMFQKIESKEIENITYLNQTDFNYEFEFQRKSSISLIEYYCNSCKTVFIGPIRIGYPLFPEKNIIEGKIGSVEIEEIFEVNTRLEDFKK